MKDISLYINENDLLLFLDIKQTTLRNFVKNKVFSKHTIGAKNFYLKSEIDELLYSNKTVEKNASFLDKYIDNKFDKLYKRKDHVAKFAIAHEILHLMSSIDEVKLVLTEHEYTLLHDFLESKNTIRIIANKHKITRGRVLQIIEKSIRRLRKFTYVTIDRYKEMVKIYEEVENLRSENLFLKRQLIINPSDTQEDIFIKSYKIRLIDMDISVRTYNCLKAGDINNLGELAREKISELAKFRNMGRKSLNEIENILLSYGIKPTK